MCKVLVLAADSGECSAWKEKLEKENSIIRLTVETASSPEDARLCVVQSIQQGAPYEIILMDHCLTPECDSVNVMNMLREQSRNSAVVIMMEAGDPESEAIIEGATRILRKPVDLSMVIATLRNVRDERRKDDWSRIFIQIAIQAQECQDFYDAAKVIVDGVLRLGFQRSRLFWVDEEDNESAQPKTILGIKQAGIEQIEGFGEQRFLVSESTYTQKAIAQKKTHAHDRA